MVQDKTASFWYRCAIEAKHNRQWTDAVFSINRAIEKNKTIGHFYLLRGYFKARLGEKELATKDVLKFYLDFPVQNYFTRFYLKNVLTKDEWYALHELIIEQDSSVSITNEKHLTFKEKVELLTENGVKIPMAEIADEKSLLKMIILEGCNTNFRSDDIPDVETNKSNNPYHKWFLLNHYSILLSSKVKSLRAIEAKLESQEDLQHFTELHDKLNDIIKDLRFLSDKITDKLLTQFPDFIHGYLLKFESMSIPIFQGRPSPELGAFDKKLNILRKISVLQSTENFFIHSYLIKNFWYYTKEHTFNVLPWRSWIISMDNFLDELKAGNYSQEMEIFGAENLGINTDCLDEYLHRKENYHFRLAQELSGQSPSNFEAS